MIDKTVIEKIEEKLNCKTESVDSISGGCISHAFRIIMKNKETYLLKVNNSVPVDMFKCEANGLNELMKPAVIRVPRPVLADNNFILMEFISGRSEAPDFFEQFGRNFARLHRFKSGSFGFYENNYIGSTPQINIPSKEESENWIKFYFNKRLKYQFSLAEKNGFASADLKKSFAGIENKIDTILATDDALPSLLHGDLWSGNYIADEKGNACLIDPAVYYGHREADLAMTKLFGGFSNRFYLAYDEEYPLADGYNYRENIYKLYHVLNHLNLFGAAYHGQAVSLMNFYL
ncbi:MAG: fructosamine kinase family protein [Ignavibacteriaceae bacterium]